MPEITEVIRPGWRGWWPNQSPLGAVPDTLLSGSNCVPTGPGKLQSFAGYGAGTATAGATMFPVKDTIGSIGTGSINYDRGDTYWWIGTGTATVGSSSLGAATSSLQLKIGLAGTAYTAGLARPVLAANALATNGAGNMTGTYSVKIAYKRSATGAVSNASEKSKHGFGLVEQVAVDGTSSRRRYWRRPGSGVRSPSRILRDWAVAVPVRAYDLEGAPTVITALGPFGNGQWADGDRSSYFAPLENYAPPTGTTSSRLGVKCVLGCYGGAWNRLFVPAKPESFAGSRSFPAGSGRRRCGAGRQTALRTCGDELRRCGNSRAWRLRSAAADVERSGACGL